MFLLESNAVIVNKITPNIAEIEAKSGVEINQENSAKGNKAIAEAMGCNYGMLIKRNEDYSIDPVPVYEVLNNIESLKAIALLLRPNASTQLVAMEQKLFKGKLEAFWDHDTAVAWLSEQLKAYED